MAVASALEAACWGSNPTSTTSDLGQLEQVTYFPSISLIKHIIKLKYIIKEYIIL